MNTAYGKPNAESLPFALRHLRWPIIYHLADSSAPDKDDQFENLVQTLVKAVGLILSKLSSSPDVPIEKFVPQKATANSAIYFDKAEDLVVEGPLVVRFHLSFQKAAKCIFAFIPLSPCRRLNQNLLRSIW